MNAIEILIEEHNNIKVLLDIVRKANLNLINGEKVNDEDFRNIIYFIRNYADSHHHQKEEIFLFNRMVDEIGPTAEKLVKHGMLVEHDLGRLYIKQLEEALDKYKEGNEEFKLDIIGNAFSYTDLLSRHIFKEDNVAYKFAERELSKELIDKINKECLEFEDKNNNVKEKCLDILEKLKKKYL